MAIASTDGRVMMFADAVFAPRTRTELQGDGGSTLGVFGCVGSCGGGLKEDEIYKYCYDPGDWHTGTGNPCDNANTAVPSNQGTGTYNNIASWDVSRVANMRYSKSTVRHMTPGSCPFVSLYFLFEHFVLIFVCILLHKNTNAAIIIHSILLCL